MRRQREGTPAHPPARPTHRLLLIFLGGRGVPVTSASMLLHVGGGQQALPGPRANTGMGLGRCRAAHSRAKGDEASAPARPWGLPVEEGGEEAAQEDFVLHSRAQVAVHQLPARDIDARACGRRAQTDREALSPDPGLQATAEGAGGGGSGLSDTDSNPPPGVGTPGCPRLSLLPRGPVSRRRPPWSLASTGRSPNCLPALRGTALGVGLGKPLSHLSVAPRSKSCGQGWEVESWNSGRGSPAQH